MKGILGKKIGMTQVYSDHGQLIPVTAIEVLPNVVTSIKTADKNGYVALQLSAFDKREKLSNKPMIGHFKKANTTPKRFTREIRNMEGYELGSTLDASIFNSGELVDVIGISKGKGFAGAIKRHNQKIGPKSHGGGGGSKPVRQTGSLGDISGNKVIKGMTMPGHMGHEQKTIQNLLVVQINKEDNYILVKGSIPGPNKGFVIIQEAVKGLPNKDKIQLVNIKEEMMKNELLESAKKVNAEISVDMSLAEMKSIVDQKTKEKEEQEKLEKEGDK